MVKQKTTLGFGAERFLASLLALTSFGSYNRCISDFAIAPSKFLASLGTSDMPKTLDKIADRGKNIEINYEG
ncbi:hypothetical protein [Desulfurobacterium atlanticum]|uniref:Uncharacterized protein n=1 Tax=Desulfurobacterium atlanticum TaxID=240169 RepID=A0A238ZKN5_9BACT|nr:hypothetical protein [Desulfurobacterium atlanticum]SNR83689.1 hypothetical protein SAMN06265340_10940 [Desulfurobacterium atlanticum]